MPATIEMRAVRLKIEDVVCELKAILGPRSVALLGGVRDTRSVRAWINGEYPPSNERALRFALQIADIIGSREERDVVRAWFEGTNHLLDDENPLLLIANRSDSNKALLSAARQFISE